MVKETRTARVQEYKFMSLNSNFCDEKSQLISSKLNFLFSGHCWKTHFSTIRDSAFLSTEGPSNSEIPDPLQEMKH